MRRLLVAAVWFAAVALGLAGVGWVGAAFALTGLALVWQERRMSGRVPAITPLWAAAGVAGALLTWGIHQADVRRLPALPRNWSGEVTGYASVREDAVSYVVSPAGAAGAGVRVRLMTGGLQLVPGVWVRVSCTVRPIEAPLNEFEFDYQSYSVARGVPGTCVAGQALVIPTQESGRAWGPAGAFGRFRWAVVRHVQQAELPQEVKGVLLALSLGDSGAVDPGLRQMHGTVGTAHLLAVSGLHLLCLFSAVLALLTRLLRRFPGQMGANRRLCLAASLAAATMYLIVTGAPTSCMRAYVMLCGYAAAQWLHRDYDLASWLSLSSLLTLAFRPHALFEAGFQLSTVSVAAIAWAVARGDPAGGREPAGKPRQGAVYRAGGYLWKIGVVSAAAWLGTAPFVWYHFHLLPTASIPANLTAVPLVTFLVLPLVLLDAAILRHVDVVSHVALEIVRHLLFILDASLEQLASWLPGVIAPWPGAAVAALLAWGALVALFGRRRGAKWCGGVIVAVCLAVVLVLASRGPEPALHFVHSGEGDATVIHLPCGRTVLVDGGRPETGSRALWPYLAARGVSDVALAIVTHGHQDHYGGLETVGARLPLDSVLTGPGPASRAVRRRLIRRPDPAGSDSNALVVSRGARFSVCDAQFTVLWPPADTAGLAENDQSLVLEVRVGWTNVLLTGDITGAILPQLLPSIPHVDILKAPHHGHATQGAGKLLDATQARLVVVTGNSPAWWADGGGQREPPRPEKAVILVTGKVGAITIPKGRAAEVFSE